jgi:hypothetical protein
MTEHRGREVVARVGAWRIEATSWGRLGDIFHDESSQPLHCVEIEGYDMARTPGRLKPVKPADAEAALRAWIDSGDADAFIRNELPYARA